MNLYVRLPARPVGLASSRQAFFVFYYEDDMEIELGLGIHVAKRLA